MSCLPEIPDIKVKEKPPNHPSLLGLDLIRRRTSVEVGVEGGGVQSGSLQGSRSWCHTLPILIRCCHGGGRISRERLIISAAERSRGRVRAPPHSQSLSLLFWWEGGAVANALVYSNMTGETDAGRSWAQVQSDEDLAGRQERVSNPRRPFREAKRSC